MIAQPDLSIIIVNWNAREYLRQCLTTIPGAVGELTYEVIVVDNASSDESAAMVREHFPATQVLEPGHNLGFGRGNQLGVERAKGQFLALMNPDLILEPGSLKKLVHFLRTKREAGLAGPRIVLPDGHVQNKLSDLPGLLSAVPGTSEIRGKSLEGVSQPARCGFIHGSCMVFRREALEAIGGFPVLTFMYGEEILVGHRLKQRGYEVWVEPRVKVIHYDDVSANQRWSSNEKAITKKSTRIQVMREIMSLPNFLLWNLLMLIGITFKWVVSPFRPSPESPLFPALLKMHLQGFRLISRGNG